MVRGHGYHSRFGHQNPSITLWHSAGLLVIIVNRPGVGLLLIVVDRHNSNNNCDILSFIGNAVYYLFLSYYYTQICEGRVNLAKFCVIATENN